MRLVAALLLSFACAAGCGGPGKQAPPPKAEAMPATAAPAAATAPAAAEPSCEDAAAHAIQVLVDSPEMKKMEPKQQEAAKTMLDGLQDEIATECRKKAWTVAVRQCVLDGKTMDDIEHCDVPREP
jgi:hypothetical protein